MPNKNTVEDNVTKSATPSAEELMNSGLWANVGIGALLVLAAGLLWFSGSLQASGKSLVWATRLKLGGLGCAGGAGLIFLVLVDPFFHWWDTSLNQLSKAIPSETRALVGLVGILVSLTVLFFFLPSLAKISFAAKYGALVKAILPEVLAGVLMLVSVKLFADG